MSRPIKINVYTLKIKCLFSVDFVSKTLEDIYLSFRSSNIEVNLFTDEVEQLITRRTSDEEIVNVIIHPGVLQSNLFSSIVESLVVNDRLIIHLYGDFSRHASYIKAQLEKINLSQLTLISPSQAFGRLISTLISAERSIEHIPFSVLPSESCSDLISLKKQKKEKLLQSNHNVFLYTGRLSDQKNIDFVIEIFNNLSRHLKNRSFLYVIGALDELEVATVGDRSKLGSMYQLIKEFKDERIIFIDHLDKASLNEYYLAADFFISASTFHDEDFGISPLESLYYGCFNILSHWGGFVDLVNHFTDMVHPIKVAFDNDSRLCLEWSEQESLNCLEKFNKFKLNINNNEQLFLAYKNEAIVKKISNILLAYEQNNYVMTSTFNQLANNGRKFFYGNDGKINRENYLKVYKDFGICES